MSANSIDSDQYVDGSIDAAHLSSGAQSAGFTPTSVGAATESVTLPNGMIFKFGSGTATALNLDVTFGTAFPNAIYSAACTVIGSAGTSNASFDSAPTTSGLSIKTNVSGAVIHWQAWGY
jgi:hypothetical protein